MDLLILGGTLFLGRWLVEAARARGHRVTLFNRGRHNPELFPDVEKLRGDRAQDLSALDGRRWDAVIDTCGYAPSVVRASADRLAPRVDRYVFVSTISVYRDWSTPGVDEGGPLAELPEGAGEAVTGETYGPLKALCEQALEAALPGRALVVRPGLIVGPHDPSGRFTYWPVRAARGGEVLAPGRPEAQVQFIDARDLAEWTVRLVEQGGAGRFNATGPERPLEMGAVLEACAREAGAEPSWTWVDDAFLVEQGVQPYTELPLWIPAGPETAGLNLVDCSRALAAGLTFRPLQATVRDTLEWARAAPEPLPPGAGLAPDRERELLDAWRARGCG